MAKKRPEGIDPESLTTIRRQIYEEATAETTATGLAFDDEAAVGQGAPAAIARVAEAPSVFDELVLLDQSLNRPGIGSTGYGRPVYLAEPSDI